MSVKDRAIAFCKRFGKVSGLAAAKSGAKMALSALLPGGSVVVELVELVLDCVHETAKDQLTFEDRPLPATAEDMRRVEDMLATLTDDLAPLMERVVRLEQRQDEVDLVFVEAMAALDEHGRSALLQIDHLARRFDRLEEQNKKLLQEQGYAAGLLQEMLPLMRHMAGVADFIEDLCQARVTAADFRLRLQEFQDAARAFGEGNIAEAATRFQMAAQSQPRSAAAATALAGARAAAQDYDAAEQMLAQAVEVHPDKADLLQLYRYATNWKKKERTLTVLRRHRRVAPGTMIELLREAMPSDSDDRHSGLFRARIGDLDSQQPIIWEYDHHAYSLTNLSILLEQHGLRWFRPKTFELWRIKGHPVSMWDEAERLRGQEQNTVGVPTSISEIETESKGTKKENTLQVLRRHCVIDEGDEIELLPAARTNDGTSRDPTLFRARIGNLDSSRSIIWEYDQKPYSLTKLSIMLEQHGLIWFKSKTFELWRLVGETESLWDQAEPLRRVTASHCEEPDLSPEDEAILDRLTEERVKRKVEEDNRNPTLLDEDAD